MNRPFCTVHIDVVDETKQETSSATLAGQNVIITKDLQRQIFDTVRTTVTPNPYSPGTYGPTPMNYSLGLQNGNASNVCPTNFTLRAEKYAIPGGVCFVFKPSQQYGQVRFDQFVHQPYSVFGSLAQQHQQFNQPMNLQPQLMNWQPRSLQDEIVMNQMKKYGVEMVKYQNHMQNQPFQLQFHRNQGTTTDTSPYGHDFSVSATGGLPDFSNVSAAAANNMIMEQGTCTCQQNVTQTTPKSPFPEPPSQFGPDARKLCVKKDLDDSHRTRNIFEDISQQESNMTGSAQDSSGYKMNTGPTSPYDQGSSSPCQQGSTIPQQGSSYPSQQGSSTSPYPQGSNSPYQQEPPNPYQQGSNSPCQQGQGPTNPYQQGSNSPYQQVSNSPYRQGSTSPCQQGSRTPESSNDKSMVGDLPANATSTPVRKSQSPKDRLPGLRPTVLDFEPNNTESKPARTVSFSDPNPEVINRSVDAKPIDDLPGIPESDSNKSLTSQCGEGPDEEDKKNKKSNISDGRQGTCRCKSSASCKKSPRRRFKNKQKQNNERFYSSSDLESFDSDTSLTETSGSETKNDKL